MGSIDDAAGLGDRFADRQALAKERLIEGLRRLCRSLVFQPPTAAEEVGPGLKERAGQTVDAVTALQIGEILIRRGICSLARPHSLAAVDEAQRWMMLLERAG